MKQKTVSGSGISWAICKSAPRTRQITMPAPTAQFLQAGCPSCRPTNRPYTKTTYADRMMHCRPAEFQFYSCLMSMLSQLPLCLVLMDYGLVRQTTVLSMIWQILNGIVYHIQSMYAWVLMEYISTVTHRYLSAQQTHTHARTHTHTHTRLTALCLGLPR